MLVLGVAAVGACDARNAFEVQLPDGTEIILADGFAINDGESLPLTVTVRDALGNPVDATLTWRSSNSEIVTVNTTGIVTGQRPGQATITASSSGVTASTDVTVRAVPTELEYVAGSGQQGPELEPLAEQLAVRVVDRRGNPVQGVVVDFIVQSGGGSANPTSTSSDADGYARSTWTVGTSGEQALNSVAQPPAHVESIADPMVPFSAMALDATDPQPTPGEPAAVTNLAVTGTTETAVTLSWTAVSDGAGGSAKYAIRYGSPTVQWGAAFETEQTIAAGTNGAPVTHTVTGLTAGTAYQFRLVSYRGTLNQDAVFGPYSNVASATTDAGTPPPPPPPPTVASVTASPASHAFTALGATRQVTATARDASGNVLSGTQFTWTSTNAGVVSVSGSGLMTAQAEGSAQIIVAASGVADTVNATVDVADPPPPPTVATVTASPSSHTFTTLGATQQITATARDGSGNVVSGAEFSWSSTNSSVVSVDNMGRMTANAVGTALIVVSSVCCGASDTVNAQVEVEPPPPPGSGGYPNRPSGLTLLGRNDGSVKETSAGAFGIADFGSWDSPSSTNITVVSDPSNPTGSGQSLRFRWDAGSDEAGVATANTFAGGPYRELYIMIRVYMEPGGWDFGHKFFYVGAHTDSRNQGGGPTSYYTDRPGAGNPRNLRFLTQNNGSVAVVDTDRSVLQQGTWLNIEYRLVAESSPGAGDGDCFIWVNGTLVGSNTSIAWNQSNDPTVGFNGMEWYAKANTVATTSYYRLGELYIAGRK